jgi:outer membrane protein
MSTMKNLFRISLLAVILLGLNFSAYSQAKFGHIDTNQLLQQMPGRQAATQELEKFARELETQFTALQTEFQTKYQNFLENQQSLSQTIRQTRERELMSLQERIQEFQESAQQDLMQKENQLLRPIIDRARQAIQEVAKENGYTYVFDSSTGVLLYSEPSDDLMERVKAKIGIR